jgi:hypothetical protein
LYIEFLEIVSIRNCNREAAQDKFSSIASMTHRVPDPSQNEKRERKKLELATKPDAHLRGALVMLTKLNPA